MDKYIKIIEEPQYNCMINEKEHSHKLKPFQKQLYNFDQYIYNKWKLPRIYKKGYTTKSYKKVRSKV